MTDKGFAEKITDLRKNKLLSQKQLGEMLGVSNKAVSKWERGESMPQMKTIVKLAEIFEISPEELLTGSKYDNEKSSTSTRLDKLESENIMLRKEVAGANKKGRVMLGIVGAICAVLAAVIIILVLDNTKSQSNPNDAVKALGKDGTCIEFCDERFVPATVLENDYYYSYLYNSDEKYATFVDANGEKSKILVSADDGDCVVVNQKGKDFVYVNENKRLQLKADNIEEIELFCQDSYNYSTKYINKKKGIDYFLKYYDAKKVPDNAVTITKRYMDNKAYNVSVEFKYSYKQVDLGTVFSDDNGHIYFYDNVTAQTYEMGGDLFEYTTNY